MRHLRHRFRKAHVPRREIDVHEDATDIKDEQARLPTELLILIASYSERRGDLATLCRVSKTLRNVTVPILYRVIEVQADGSGSGGDTEGHLLLYRTLQDIRFSQAVTEVHLTLKDYGICAKHIPSTIKWRSSGHRCSCDDYDRALGKALLCLNNLEVLDLQCGLCRGRHFRDYLPHLDMPKLKELSFGCYRSSPKGRSPQFSSILVAPCMQNINALSLDCDFDWLCGNAPGYGQFLQNASILPRLRTLRHNGRNFCNDLLAARPVERLCVDQRSQENSMLLHEGIRRSPGKVSHLLMVNIIEWLPNSMGQDLEPYRHLRHISTIAFPELEEAAALRAMRVFIPLSNLRVVEINRLPKSQDEDEPIRRFQYIFSPGPSFFDLLGSQHPALRRVLLITRQYGLPGFSRGAQPVLWEWSGEWERRLAPSFGHWEILNGKLDRL